MRWYKKKNNINIQAGIDRIMHLANGGRLIIKDETKVIYMDNDGGIFCAVAGDEVREKMWLDEVYLIDNLYEAESISPEGLWKKPTLDDIPFGDFTPQIPLSHLFGDHKQCDAWRRALTTFVELKSLDYCAAPAGDKEQYFIVVSNSSSNVVYDSTDRFDVKLERISPPFNCTADADKAIKEIGKDRLMHMFKTFQGIYA